MLRFLFVRPVRGMLLCVAWVAAWIWAGAACIEAGGFSDNINSAIHATVLMVSIPAAMLCIGLLMHLLDRIG